MAEVIRFREFVRLVIEDGKARSGHSTPLGVEGWLNGLKSCSGLDVKSLEKFRKASQATADFCGVNRDPELDFWVGRADAVEWVCQVVSAALGNQLVPIIVQPSPAAALVATSILFPKSLDPEDVGYH